MTAPDPAAHLADAAVEAGEVPEEVAAWIADGARSDPGGAEPYEGSRASTAQRWAITDLGGATWAMRKVKAAETGMAEANAAYAVEMARLNAWRDKALRPHTRTAAFMEERLVAWALGERERTGEATILTPAGEVRTRRPAAPWKLTVADKTALVEYALANGRAGLTQPVPAGIVALTREVEVVETMAGELVCVDPESDEIVPGLVATATTYTASVVPS